jgi:ubiquinone/menaquinone biosynthesis C-methylase UbiE
MGDGRDLPLRSQTFDAVINCDVIEHVESNRERSSALLKEEVRVPKAGGHLFLYYYARKHSISKKYRVL